MSLLHQVLQPFKCPYRTIANMRGLQPAKHLSSRRGVPGSHWFGYASAVLWCCTSDTISRESDRRQKLSLGRAAYLCQPFHGVAIILHVHLVSGLHIKMKRLNQYPFLARADKLKFSFPSLGTSIRRITKTNDSGRRLLNDVSIDQHGNFRPPGRCCVLEFRDSAMGAHVEDVMLQDISSLANYLELYSPLQGKAIQGDCSHRLYILEDLSPEYVDLLGAHLRVDPLVISTHMNTWRNLDAKTAAQRTLPSLRSPRDMFTVRYPELRVYDRSLEGTRWTFAVNRRKIESWFQIPGGTIGLKGEVSITRHCASYWVDNTRQRGGAWNGMCGGH